MKHHPFSRTPDGGLDPARFVDEWRLLRDGSGGRPKTTGRLPPVGGDGATLDDKTRQLLEQQTRAKARMDVDRAKMSRLRRRRAEGRTFDLDEGTRFFAGLMQEAQDAVLAIPASRATEGADELGCDAAALEVWLERVLREDLAELTAEKLERAERFRRDKGAANDG